MFTSKLRALLYLLNCLRVHIGDLVQNIQIRLAFLDLFNFQMGPLTVHFFLHFRFWLWIRGRRCEQHRWAIEELDITRFNGLAEFGISLQALKLQTPPSLIAFWKFSLRGGCLRNIIILFYLKSIASVIFVVRLVILDECCNGLRIRNFQTF